MDENWKRHNLPNYQARPLVPEPPREPTVPPGDRHVTRTEVVSFTLADVLEALSTERERAELAERRAARYEAALQQLDSLFLYADKPGLPASVVVAVRIIRAALAGEEQG